MVYKCGACDLTCRRAETLANCNACNLPYHEKCSGLPNAEFLLISSKKSKLKWFCRICDVQVSEILTNFEKLKKMNAELKGIKDEIDRKMSNFESRLQKCEKLENNPELGGTIRKLVKDSIPETTSDEEKAAIDRKKLNLIYFKIPESNSDEIEHRLKDDYEKLVEIYGAENVKPSDINGIFRVGKKSQLPRPLIVKFKDSNTKQIYCVMSFGKRLTIRHENEIINIVAAHDKTKKQREEYKKCLDELNTRRQEGETNLHIRNNRVVKNFLNATGGPKTTWADIAKTLN